MSAMFEKEISIKRLIQALHIAQIKDFLFHKHSILPNNFNPADEKQKKIISNFNIPLSYKVCRNYQFSSQTFKCTSSFILFIYLYNEEESKYEKHDCIIFKRIDDLVVFLANKLNE